VFAVTSAPVGAERGGHAHRSGMQLLVCLQGRIEATLRAGEAEARLVLAPGSGGLLFGPGVWRRQTYLEAGAVLVVFASDPYDPASYLDHPTDPG
jgi:quercetin dioxygenase-like cupin family protein